MNQRSAKKVPQIKILNTALALFSSKGYAETKMAEIAGGAGLSVGTLYLRFKNKEDLCLELIKDQTRGFVEQARNLSHEDPEKTLKKYIALNLEYSLRKKRLLSLFFREYNLPFLQPLRKSFFIEQHRIIADILTSGIKRGVFRPLDIKDTASIIFASIRGAVLLKLIFGIGDTKKMGESLFHLVTRGIGKDAR